MREFLKSRWLLAVLLVGGIELIVGSVNGFEFHGPTWAMVLGAGMVGFYVGLTE